MRFYILVIAAISYLAYVSSDACVQCNSATDPKCATNPDQFMAKDCKNTSSICYMRVKDGHTIRGCASDLDNNTRNSCNSENECVMCSYLTGCNRLVFPLHRAQCLQCEGNSTGTCAQDIYAKPTVCPIFKLGDKCYIRNNGRNNTNSFQRGCLSSAQANKVCIKDGNCFTCEGVGCNALEFNSTQIPVARDSATAFGYSMSLLLAAIMALRYF